MGFKWFAIMMIGFFLMVSFGTWLENKSEASKIDACGRLAIELQKDCLDKIQ